MKEELDAITRVLSAATRLEATEERCRIILGFALILTLICVCSAVVSAVF